MADKRLSPNNSGIPFASRKLPIPFREEDASLAAGPRDIAQIIKRNRQLLSSSIAEDIVLSKAGRQTASHAFLANSTQAVYARQVEFLSAILTEYTNLQPPAIRVLDWGCGKGHITYLLKTRGFDVLSCDISRSQGDSAFGQETPLIRQLAIPVVPLNHEIQLPFADRSFDCVVSFGVLEHVKSDRDSLAEIHRILKPGGVLFIAFLPYFLSWTQAAGRLGGDNYHDRLYRIKSFTQLATDSHFEVVRLSLAQLLPKNSVRLALDGILEPIDRFLCARTPLRYLATNLEAILVRR